MSCLGRSWLSGSGDADEIDALDGASKLSSASFAVIVVIVGLLSALITGKTALRCRKHEVKRKQMQESTDLALTSSTYTEMVDV